jgi:TRAP-type mannitol/chloroaromatic compound transport system substrate-binding protein
MSKSPTEIPGGESPDNASGSADSKEDGRVAYETYQKVLREKKNRDEQLKSVTERLAAFEAEKTALEEAKLKEQG